MKDWQVLISFLADQPANEEATTADLALLAGNTLPFLTDQVAEMYQAKRVKKIFLVGGIGHATKFLRHNFKKLGWEFPADRSEAEMNFTYLRQKYAIPPTDILVEKDSTNCGENAYLAKKRFLEQEEICKSLFLIQEPLLQKRSQATFQKHWQDLEVSIDNYVPYVPIPLTIEPKLTFQNPIFDTYYETDYFLNLALSELPRLRNTLTGYGPLGKNFIVDVPIPKEVEASYQRLCQDYCFQWVRG